MVGCTKNYVEPQRLRNTPITLIDVFDRPGASQEIQVRIRRNTDILQITNYLKTSIHYQILYQLGYRSMFNVYSLESLQL